MANDNWWFKFDWEEWRGDTDLGRCSLESQGFWIRCICAMHAAEVAELAGTPHELARLIGCFPDELMRCLLELKKNNAADVIIGNGFVSVVSRRRQRELKAKEYNRLQVQAHRQKVKCNDDVKVQSKSKSKSKKKEEEEVREAQASPLPLPQDPTDPLEHHPLISGITGSLDDFDGEVRNKRSVWTVTTQPFSDWTKTSHLVRVQEGETSDDMKHIVFPDCPSCEDLFGRLTSALCDEHEADLMSRIGRIGSHLAQERASDFVPIVRNLVSDSWQRNSGYSRLCNLLSANGHNSQNHKKVRDLLTSFSYSSFVQILSDISDRRDGLLWFVLYASMTGNNISLDGLDARLLDKIPHCKIDKFSCSYCQVYTVITSETSHFATFPPKLIEPCILAGSREGDIVLDPFNGSGTSGLVALRHRRRYLGIELNPEYIELSEKRLSEIQVNLF